VAGNRALRHSVKYRKRGAELVPCTYKAPAMRIGNVDPKLTEQFLLKPVCRRCATDVLEPRGISTFNLAGTIRRRVEDYEIRLREYEESVAQEIARETESEEAFEDFKSDMRLPDTASAKQEEPKERPYHGYRIGDDPTLRRQLRNAVPTAPGNGDGRQQRQNRPGGKKGRKATQQPAPQAERVTSS